jgi:hypothetical protein
MTMKDDDKHRLIIKYPREMHARLKLIAYCKHVSLNSIVVEALTAALEIHEAEYVEKTGRPLPVPVL